jgi:hypothetical protein
MLFVCCKLVDVQQLLDRKLETLRSHGELRQPFMTYRWAVPLDLARQTINARTLC